MREPWSSLPILEDALILKAASDRFRSKYLIEYSLWASYQRADMRDAANMYSLTLRRCPHA